MLHECVLTVLFLLILVFTLKLAVTKLLLLNSSA